MKQINVTFQFDEKKLGKEWFNIDNLRILLYSNTASRKELLTCELTKPVKNNSKKSD